MGHEGPEHDEGGHGHQGHGRASVPQQHKSHAPVSVAAFVVTCSDSRGSSSDEGGRAIVDALQTAGHTIIEHRIIRDEPELIRRALSDAAAAGARALIFTGGTGIGSRDNTVDVLSKAFDKALPGFGELFRYLSFKEIGSPAMMSRATAGTYQGMIVFGLPGSPQAVKLAMNELILPELGHAVRELTR